MRGCQGLCCRNLRPQRQDASVGQQRSVEGELAHQPCRRDKRQAQGQHIRSDWSRDGCFRGGKAEIWPGTYRARSEMTELGSCRGSCSSDTGPLSLGWLRKDAPESLCTQAQAEPAGLLRSFAHTQQGTRNRHAFTPRIAAQARFEVSEVLCCDPRHPYPPQMQPHALSVISPRD